MNLAPDSVISFFAAIADSVEPLTHDSPDGGSGLLMSALAGGASALAVATCWRSISEADTGARATSSGTALPRRRCSGCLPLWPTTCGTPAFAYLGINPPKPEVEFEIRRPTATESALVDARIELRTDRNQTLA